MNWYTILLPVIGAFIVGLLTTLIAIWIKDYLYRKREAQEWFNETYIINGVELVLAYIGILNCKYLVTINIEYGPSSRNVFANSEPDFPMVALRRVGTIVGEQNILHAVTLVRLITFYPPKFKEESLKDTYMKQIYFYQDDLQKILEKLTTLLINIKINSKNDVYTLYLKSDIEECRKECDKLMDDMRSFRSEILKK